MTHRSWLRSLFATRTPRTIRKMPARSLLAVEALEERALLTVSFAPAVNTQLLNGVGPSAVAIGDFRGLGNQDLVTIDSGSDQFSWLGGFGNGAFTVDFADYTKGTKLSSVVLGDFNGDHKLDVAIANSGTDNVSVYLNSGNSSAPFGADLTYATGATPLSVAVGDFDGDGKLDLVTANSGSDNVSVLRGNGNGTFQTSVNYVVGASPRSVAVGDFDGDGKLDMVTANSTDNSIRVLLNTGTGTFGSAVKPSVGAFPVSLAVGDFNRDGKLDLVTANNIDSTISVLLNTGTGTGTVTFGSADNYAARSGPSTVAVGDFDGDGTLDLVTGYSYGAAIDVYMGNSDGTLQSPVSFAVGFRPKAVAVADLNRDGKPDLVTANTDSNSISGLLNITPPTIAGNPAGVKVKKGAQATNTGTFNGSGGRNTVALTASVGAVTKDDAAGTWNWTYTPTSGPAVANVTITAKDNSGLTATTTFPLTVYTNASNAKFVQALYRYELGRNADPTGLTGWMGTFAGPGGQAAVVSGIVNSAEGRNRLVGIWYQTYLGRSATSSEISASATLLASQTEEQVLSQLLGNTEYFNRAQTRGFGGTPNENLVLALFQDLLGRRPADVGFWVSRLQTRGQVGLALDLLQGSEYRGIVVSGYYTNLLGRTGSSAEVNGWASGTRDLRDIRKLFESGPEFFIHNATLAPTITSFSVPTAGNEGSLVTLNTDATNPAGPSFPLTYLWTVTRPDGTTLTALSGPSATFTPPDNGNYGISLRVADEDGFSVTRTATDAVANVTPTPTLSGFTTGLATQVLTYTASATDPSSIDQAAGFAHSINWGDGSTLQTINRTAGDGSGVSISHVFTTVGTYTVTLSSTDKDNGTRSTTRTVTVLGVTSANMQTVINQQGPLTFQDSTDAQAQSVVTAINGLSAQSTPVTLTMNLGNANYTDLAPSPKAGITLVISGSGGTTTIVGHSPALNVTGGNVILSNLTMLTDTDSPTVVVSGGHLTLRNITIEESSGADQPALLITGGTVDLGTQDSPGGNSFNGHGQGELIHNASASAVSALGNTFEADGVTISSPYRIKDEIFDALNAGGGGLVSYVANNVYVTQISGSIQRGVNAVAPGGTVNVEAGSYKQYDAGSKLVTIAFENGPVLTQEADALDPSVRTLVVTGTPGNDKILLNPGDTGSTVKIMVNDVASGTFSPTGRLIAYAGAGDDDIQVAGGLTLPAWLYGGDGNDRLKGGGGNNVLLGGAGDDQLIAGGSRNLLIGGLGADTLNAGSGDDLLIAGTTTFDANEAALGAIMAEWTSGRDYATRVANLSGTGSGPRNNGNYFLIASGPNATVFDDGAMDVLQGGSGIDWFFAGLSQDLIHGRRDSEIVENL